MSYQLFHYRGESNRSRAGLHVKGRYFDIDGASLDSILENWAEWQPKLDELAASAAGGGSALPELDSGVIAFGPVASSTATIYGAGANYRDHVEAMARALNMKLSLDPKGEGIPPWHFIKPGRATLAAHGERVEIPPYCRRLDWEAELAVIIGVAARNVSVERALEHVAGYSCANDLSARDAFARHAVDLSSPFHFDWLGHKCFPGACPIGPFLTPARFVPSPETLGIRLWLNGTLRQDGNTSNHLYGVAEQIAYLSTRLELLPGDVILTGTPAGVGMERGTFLSSGDVMRVEIDGLGSLVTHIA